MTDLRTELGKRNAFDSPQQEAYLALQHTASELAGPFHDLFKSHGLTESSFNVLRIVAGHGKRGIPAQRIGPLMVQRLPDVTRLVDRLTKKALTERVTCDDDRRVKYVRATAQGRRLLSKINPKLTALHTAQLRGLSDADTQRLIALLQKAREAATTPPL